MDLIIATSEHSKKGFEVVYDVIDEKAQKKKGEVKIETPIEVLFEGLDLEIYNKQLIENDKDKEKN